jgi:hypothetical protein
MIIIQVEKETLRILSDIPNLQELQLLKKPRRGWSNFVSTAQTGFAFLPAPAPTAAFATAPATAATHA